jgi:hypothetical protein
VRRNFQPGLKVSLVAPTGTFGLNSNQLMWLLAEATDDLVTAIANVLTISTSQHWDTKSFEYTTTAPDKRPITANAMLAFENGVLNNQTVIDFIGVSGVYCSVASFSQILGIL